MHDPNSLPELDLHRRTWAEAERIVRRALHTWRLQGVEVAVLVTGRGYGNAKQEPVLRTKVERWLDTPDARGLGVRSWRRVAKDGALEVTLASARRGD
ncbi:MAG: Smr/MutS family protein [Planctomycetes bacterium]|nr:Smr/MutS family protein [Planctomycetota bacterium]